MHCEIPIISFGLDHKNEFNLIREALVMAFAIVKSLTSLLNGSSVVSSLLTLFFDQSGMLVTICFSSISFQGRPRDLYSPADVFKNSSDDAC